MRACGNSCVISHVSSFLVSESHLALGTHILLVLTLCFSSSSGAAVRKDAIGEACRPPQTPQIYVGGLRPPTPPNMSASGLRRFRIINGRPRIFNGRSHSISEDAH